MEGKEEYGGQDERGEDGGCKKEGEKGGWEVERKALHTSPFSLIFSSSLYGAYHFASLVFPLYAITHQPSFSPYPSTSSKALSPTRELSLSHHSLHSLLSSFPAATVVPISPWTMLPFGELK
jgi:hypothetical protein